jgi:hypothetical protein
MLREQKQTAFQSSDFKISSLHMTKARDKVSFFVI